MHNTMAALAALAALAACQSDSYETGQGQYSLMQADFVEAHTSAQGIVDRVETDDSHVLALAQPQTAKWAATPDSVYRALIYYELATDSVARVTTLSQVPTLHPAPLDSGAVMRTDPVKFESMWIGANGKYLNMGLYLKNGGGSDSLRHTVGMVRESATVGADGKRTVRLRLFHDQGGVPEYYSSRYYMSVPCKEIGADTVVVTVGTYDGEVERRFSLSE